MILISFISIPCVQIDGKQFANQIGGVLDIPSMILVVSVFRSVKSYFIDILISRQGNRENIHHTCFISMFFSKIRICRSKIFYNDFVIYKRLLKFIYSILHVRFSEHTSHLGKLKGWEYGYLEPDLVKIIPCSSGWVSALHSWESFS